MNKPPQNPYQNSQVPPLPRRRIGWIAVLLMGIGIPALLLFVSGLFLFSSEERLSPPIVIEATEPVVIVEQQLESTEQPQP